MQKLFIVLVLFCIFRFDGGVDGNVMAFCDRDDCQKTCELVNMNGICVIETEHGLFYHICRCY
uniref:Potassium channel blocker pMeKTx18-1b n=1 Tax=Mesobuthus eupeus TaxID=34648 RepID=A0A088DAZ3_MESEU|nr:potassium channel blocker pMeKTx18-1b [Mesobuthus eupeus]